MKTQAKPRAQMPSSPLWGQDTMLAAGVLAGCLASRLRGSRIAVAAAVGLLAWRLIAKPKTAIATEALEEPTHEPTYYPPVAKEPQIVKTEALAPELQPIALPVEANTDFDLSALDPTPLPEITEPEIVQISSTKPVFVATTLDPHWADRYLKPSPAEEALPLVAESSTELVQPTDELLAPASWLLGVEPMPLVEESELSEAKEQSLEKDVPLSFLDMDSEPSVPHWSPPATTKEASVAAIPDIIELPLISALEPAALSLSSLLWTKKEEPRVAAQNLDKPILAGLVRLEETKPSASEGDASLAPESFMAEEIPAEPEVQKFEHSLFADHQSPLLQPQPSASEQAFDDDLVFAPHLPSSSRPNAESFPFTALGVKPETSSRESTDTTANRSRTQLPPPRPKSVKPKTTVPTVITAKVGLSAASKAVALSLPKSDTSNETPEADVAPPPPRTIPRAPVTEANPQPSRKSSASWLSFWK